MAETWTHCDIQSARTRYRAPPVISTTRTLFASSHWLSKRSHRQAFPRTNPLSAFPGSRKPPNWAPTDTVTRLLGEAQSSQGPSCPALRMPSRTGTLRSAVPRYPQVVHATDAEWSRAARAALALALPNSGPEPTAFGDVRAQAIADAAIENAIPAEVQAGAREWGRPDVESLLADEVSRLTLLSLRHLSGTLLLREVLRESDIDSVVMKGLPLAALTRTSAFHRPSSDIDILIATEALPAAHAALIDNGARLLARFPAPDESATFGLYRRFRHESGYAFRGSHLDLHWRLGGNYSVYPSAATVIERAMTVRVGDVAVTAPSVEDALLHATLHWQGMGFRKMKYVLDIMGLLRLTSARSRGSLPRSARQVLAICEALASSRSDWSVPESPSPGRWWSMAVSALATPPRDPGTYAQQRRESLLQQLRDTPGLVDRAIVPLRSVAGPIARRRSERNPGASGPAKRP